MTAAVRGSADVRVREAPARSLLFEGLAIWLALSVLNLILLVRVQNESDDSVWYLWYIQRGHATELFNPYHIVASWIGWAGYNGVRLLGYGGGPLIPVQVLNALFGAFGIAVLWLLIRYVTNTRLPAIAAAGMLAMSYGYWAYSLGPDIYPFATAALIAALAGAYYATMNPRAGTYIVFGLLAAVAVLGHNSNGLFVLTVGGASLLLIARERGLRRAIVLGLWYSAGVLLVLVPVYGAGMVTVQATTPAAAYDWMTLYAQSGEWGNITASSVPKAIVGAGRAFVGGHFLFSLDAVRDWAEDTSGGKSLREEVYLVRDFPRAASYLLIIPIVAIAAGLIVLAVNWIARWRTLAHGPRTLAVLCLAWLVPVAIFAFWWEPINLEFWMAAWVPLIILLALPLAATDDRSRRIDAAVVGVLLVSLFTVNFFGSIAPQLSQDNDYWRERIAWYEENATEDDLILSNNHLESYYLRYFTDAEVFQVDGAWLDTDGDSGKAMVLVDRAIDDWDGKRVLISDEVFFPASDEYSSCKQGQRPCIDLVELVRDEYEPRSSVIAKDELEKVWQLDDR